jgi:shikimate kinase
MSKSEHCLEQLTVHLKPSTRQTVERVAHDEGRSLANVARRVLEKWAAERQPEVAA